MKLKTFAVLMLPAALALSACHKSEDRKSDDSETPIEKIEDKAANKPTNPTEKDKSATAETGSKPGTTTPPAAPGKDDKSKVDLNTIPSTASAGTGSGGNAAPSTTATTATPVKPAAQSTPVAGKPQAATSPESKDKDASMKADPNQETQGKADPKKEGQDKASQDKAAASKESAGQDSKPNDKAKPKDDKAAKAQSENADVPHNIALPNYKLRLAPTKQSDLTPAEEAAQALAALQKASEALPASTEPAKDSSDVLASIVDDARMLGAIDLKTNSTLYKGKVTPKAEALKAINKEGKGVYCQTSEADKVANGDSLVPFATPEIEKLDNDFVQTSTRMLSLNSFNLICTSKGKVTPMALQENLKPALRFTFLAPDADLPNPGEAPAKPANPKAATTAKPAETKASAKPTDPAKAVPADQRAFKISNSEILAKVISDGGQKGAEKAVQNGKVVDVKDSEKAITAGTAQEACQVIGTEGKVDKNKIYQLQNLGVETQDRAYKVMHYNYKAADQSKISLGCAMKASATNANLKNAFKSILSFPASK